MSKHIKTGVPTDADLKGDPMIGGAKGVTASGTTPDELEDALGANTLEGDAENDVNRYGGIDKEEARGGRPHKPAEPPRR